MRSSPKAAPGHHLFHLGEEAFAAGLLALPACSKSEKLIWLMGSAVRW